MRLDSGRRLGSVSYNLHGRLQSVWVQQPASGRAPVAILTPMGSIESDTGRSALAAGTAESAPFAAVREAASKPQKSRRSESCKIVIALDLPALLPERTSIR